MKYDCIVVGGGAAGCIAATVAGNRGRNVLLLERNNIIGKKLLITGKGRCNVTNDCDLSQFMNNVPVNSKFLYSAYSMFTSTDVKDFFTNLGVPLKTERGNRVFPQSDKSFDVVNALEKALKNSHVAIKNARATELITENGEIKGVKSAESIFYADNVLVATGGKSYHNTGSTGDGYSLAVSVGHTVTELKPSLVPIVSSEKYCADMMGLSLKNVVLNVIDNYKKKIIYSELGEMLFTHFGVSGPLVLSASSHMDNIEIGKYTLLIDLKPGLTEEKLDARIQRDFAEQINKDFINSLSKLLPSKMIPVIVKLSGIPDDTKVNQITKKQRTDFAKLIKSFPINVKDFRPIDEAIITSGGIRVSEISPKTMESKIVKGLYFAGEIIDVDAYTGGFNLQIAFSTGYAAGMNI